MQSVTLGFILKLSFSLIQSSFCRRLFDRQEMEAKLSILGIKLKLKSSFNTPVIGLSAQQIQVHNFINRSIHRCKSRAAMFTHSIQLQRKMYISCSKALQKQRFVCDCRDKNNEKNAFNRYMCKSLLTLVNLNSIQFYSYIIKSQQKSPQGLYQPYILLIFHSFTERIPSLSLSLKKCPFLCRDITVFIKAQWTHEPNDTENTKRLFKEGHRERSKKSRAGWSTSVMQVEASHHQAIKIRTMS